MDLPLSSLTLSVLLCSLGACDPTPASAQAPATPGNAAPTPEVLPPAPSPPPAPSSSARIEDEENTIAVFRAAAPATVFVGQTQVVTDRFSMRALEVPAGSGTGFIWDQQGHVVTNFHVVAGGRSFKVTHFDGTEYDARPIGGDEKKDIAVLRIDAPADRLVAIRLPPEDMKLEVGQKTLAIGNPFGLDHTLTVGVISALGREVKGFGGVTIRDMIQTDASINPGNSGGPLLDSQGQLIGMNTMIFSKSGASSGVGFATSVKDIRRLVPQIIEFGHAKQAGLGIEAVPDEVARRFGIRGVVIKQVTSELAKQSGLQPPRRGSGETLLFDVIVGIDAKTIDNYDDLYSALDGRAAGDKVVVHVRRGDVKLEVPIELIDLR